MCSSDLSMVEGRGSRVEVRHSTFELRGLKSQVLLISGHSNTRVDFQGPRVDFRGSRILEDRRSMFDDQSSRVEVRGTFDLRGSRFEVRHSRFEVVLVGGHAAMHCMPKSKLRRKFHVCCSKPGGNSKPRRIKS